jgi:hypothetical protein
MHGLPALPGNAVTSGGTPYEELLKLAEHILLAMARAG